MSNLQPQDYSFFPQTLECYTLISQNTHRECEECPVPCQSGSGQACLRRTNSSARQLGEIPRVVMQFW